MIYFVKRGLGWALCGLMLSAPGCGGPDPRDNPDFNESTLKSPGSIKMEPLKKPKGAR